MLKTRIFTAVVLLLLFIPALLVERHEPWRMLTLVLMVLAAWEWGRAIQVQAQDPPSPSPSLSPESLTVAHPSLMPDESASWVSAAPSFATPVLSYALAAFTALGGGCIWLANGLETLPAWASVLLGLMWSYFFSLLFSHGLVRWARAPLLFKAVAGWCVLLGTWWSIAVAQGVGSAFLLSILCVVWVADVSAYFGGKALGRHKLAPRLSPGKTWEGVASALVGVGVLAYGWMEAAAVFHRGEDSLFAVLWRHGAWTTGLALAVLVAVSVMGDLFESLIKRSSGLKDSSHLLPGHGGVLDRVDALLPTLPLAVTMLAYLR